MYIIINGKFTKIDLNSNLNLLGFSSFFILTTLKESNFWPIVEEFNNKHETKL